jgi:hypothetical protein
VILLVDDALLLSVLAGAAADELGAALHRGELFTTGSWYYRLARATHDWTFSGALSAALDALPADRRARALNALDDLPQEIGVLDIRRLVPVMRRLDVGRRLNFLTAEAVAAALALDGSLRVTTESRLLTDACRALGVDLGVVTP